MGHKVHPVGFRVGFFEDWKAHWFDKRSYGKQLLEDFRIRDYLNKELERSEISRLIIDKTGDSVKIIIHSARPGMVIGKSGKGIDQLRDSLYKKFGKHCEILVQEVRNPELDAQIVANNIAEQLERRIGYKRLMKKAGFSALRSGAKGIKICCGGRIGGAEIARKEWLRLGSIPLHTLRSKIDFATAEANTKYGIVGVKVWICRGEY